MRASPAEIQKNVHLNQVVLVVALDQVECGCFRVNPLHPVNTVNVVVLHVREGLVH
jgi:hypothetical protein